MSNFMQIGDAQNDIVLIENNVSDNQLTTTLTKANGEPITSPPVTLPSGGGTTVVANPTLSGSEAELTGLEVAGTKYKVPSGGGGTPVGGGFTFTYEAMLYSFSGLIFGQYNGVYGWIDASTIYDRDFTITNAVFVLNTAEVEDITRPDSSITAGSLYTVDGTEVTKSNMNTTINVLKVLTANCTIHVSD